MCVFVRVRGGGAFVLRCCGCLSSPFLPFAAPAPLPPLPLTTGQIHEHVEKVKLHAAEMFQVRSTFFRGGGAYAAWRLGGHTSSTPQIRTRAARAAAATACRHSLMTRISFRRGGVSANVDRNLIGHPLLLLHLFLLFSRLGRFTNTFRRLSFMLQRCFKRGGSCRNLQSCL